MHPNVVAPLVEKSLYDRVQDVLHGRINGRDGYRHRFPFRKLVRCQHCGRFLIAEKQKGHVYYRCHTKRCGTCVREEIISASCRQLLASCEIPERVWETLRAKAAGYRDSWDTDKKEVQNSLRVQLGQIRDRLSRLTDVFLDGQLEKELFESKKTEFLNQEKTLEDIFRDLDRAGHSLPDRVEAALELIRTASFLQKQASEEKWREYLKELSSNRVADGKNVVFMRSPTCDILGKLAQNVSGCPGEESNLHAFRHMHLKHAWLPLQHPGLF